MSISFFRRESALPGDLLPQSAPYPGARWKGSWRGPFRRPGKALCAAFPGLYGCPPTLPRRHRAVPQPSGGPISARVSTTAVLRRPMHGLFYLSPGRCAPSGTLRHPGDVGTKAGLLPPGGRSLCAFAGGRQNESAPQIKAGRLNRNWKRINNTFSYCSFGRLQTSAYASGWG